MRMRERHTKRWIDNKERGKRGLIEIRKMLEWFQIIPITQKQA